MTTPATPVPIRVLVCDDHAVVREGIRHVLEAEPGVTVVAEAGNAAQALALAVEHRPDVIVLDVTMPGESGLRAAPRLREAAPESRMLIMSMHDNAEYVREGMRAGAQRLPAEGQRRGGAARWPCGRCTAAGTFFSTPAAHG